MHHFDPFTKMQLHRIREVIGGQTGKGIWRGQVENFYLVILSLLVLFRFGTGQPGKSQNIQGIHITHTNTQMRFGLVFPSCFCLYNILHANECMLMNEFKTMKQDFPAFAKDNDEQTELVTGQCEIVIKATSVFV